VRGGLHLVVGLDLLADGVVWAATGTELSETITVTTAHWQTASRN
jgi:hypothetical protein